MKKILMLAVLTTLFIGCSKNELPPKEEIDNDVENTLPQEKVAVKKIFYSAVTLQKQRSFWLNSSTYLGNDKITRFSVPISLPDNVVAFYYVVSVTERNKDVSIKLNTQLSDILKRLR